MKRLLSLTALAAMMASSASAAETFEYGYCGEMKDLYGNAGQTTCIAAAIQIPESQAQVFDGYKVVGMQVALGDGSTVINPFVGHYDGSTFSREFLTDDVFYGETNKWQTVNFDSPYTIDGSEFFIGYFISPVTKGKRPLATDGATTGSEYNWIGSANSTSEMWSSFHSETSMGNICIKLIIEGDQLPADCMSIRSLDVPILVKPGEPFDITFDVTNDAYNDINTISGTYTIGDAEAVPFEMTVEPALEPAAKRTLVLNDLVCAEPDNDVTVALNIDKVNGNANKGIFTSASAHTTCSMVGYEPMIVVEEGTGTWCSACPAGIVGLEYMNENYGDSFIGIAVHVNGATGPDMMTASDFAEFATEKFPVVPTALMNRQRSFTASPSSLEENYKQLRATPVYARLNLSATYTSNTKSNVQIKADTEFATDHPSIDYALSFILTEDNVGPYMQNNGYAGSSTIMGGWETKGSSVPTMYNEVARAGVDLYGMPSSAITSAQAGDVVEFEYTMSTSKVLNKANMALIALLIDRKTGYIVNAARLRGNEIKTAGIEDIETGADDAEAEYYNLQGVRVINPTAAGVYVRRCGDKVEKIVVR